MENRTSLTHPIDVSWLREYPGLGITFAPGKQGDSIYGRAWERDLDNDVHRLRHTHHVDILISLIEDSELRLLKIPTLVATAEATGIEVRRFPIPDGGVPKPASEFNQLVRAAGVDLDRGKRVVVHCRGGHGRAGTVAGCILRAHGLTPTEALDALRARHPTECPEWPSQRHYITSFEVE